MSGGEGGGGVTVHVPQGTGILGQGFARLLIMTACISLVAKLTAWALCMHDSCCTGATTLADI